MAIDNYDILHQIMGLGNKVYHNNNVVIFVVMDPDPITNLLKATVKVRNTSTHFYVRK